MKQVTIGIFEKYKPIAFVFVRFRFEPNALFRKLTISCVEVIHLYRNVSQTGSAHPGIRPFAFGRNDLYETTIRSFDEKIA